MDEKGTLGGDNMATENIDVFKIIWIVAYQLLIMSFAHYSVWNFIYAFKFNRDNENRTNTMIANIAIALMLIFVAFSNMMIVIQEFDLLEMAFFEYVSVAYGIIMIAVMATSAYCIIGDYVIEEHFIRQKLVFRFNTFLVIVVSVIFVSAIVISEKATGTNYISVANQYYLPVFTLSIPILLLLDTLIQKRFKFQLNWRTILILLGTLCAVCDLIFFRQEQIQMSIALYALYSLHIFRRNTFQIFGGKKSRIETISETEFCSRHGLTGREMEVIKLVCQGMTNHQIAEGLFISTNTVKNHLQRIFAKLDIDSRYKLTRIMVGVKSE